MPAIRERINTGGSYEACVRDIVAAFDSSVGRYVEQLTRQVPLTQGRRNKLENRRFHNLNLVAEGLKEIFDIDILAGVSPEDVEVATRMFYRRHVYEHKGERPMRSTLTIAATLLFVQSKLFMKLRNPHTASLDWC